MKSIATVAAETGAFRTLLAAAETAGLTHVLETAGPFTVFAPTDAAFARLPAGTIENLMKDKVQLTATVMFHLVPARVTSEEIAAAGTIRPKTVYGSSLHVRVRDGSVFVNNAKVTQLDMMATNGVVHVIDRVLLPQAA